MQYNHCYGIYMHNLKTNQEFCRAICASDSRMLLERTMQTVLKLHANTAVSLPLGTLW